MKVYSRNTNISLRHLRALHAIWREGSFSRAAEGLGVVPSALSETVRQVEDRAGGLLFDRRRRPAVPTPLGLGFLKETAPILDEFDGALERLCNRPHDRRDAIRIGAAPSAITPLVAPVIGAFRNDHPDVSILLHDNVAETLADMVADGELDFAVAGRARTSPELVQTEIGADAFGLACRRDHPLAQRGGPARLEEIDPKSIIHLSGRTGSAMLLAESASLPSDMTSGLLQTHSTIAQLCLIRAGVGVALLPHNALMLFKDPGLCFVPIVNLSLVRRLFLLQPAQRALPDLAKTFVARLERFATAP